MVSLNKLVSTPTNIIKLAQWLVILIIIIFMSNGLFLLDTTISAYDSAVFVAYGTPLTWFFFIAIVLASDVLEQPINNVIILAMDFLGALLFLTAGSLMCKAFTDIRNFFPTLSNEAGEGLTLTAGIFAILISPLFVLDAILIFKIRPEPTSA